MGVESSLMQGSYVILMMANRMAHGRIDIDVDTSSGVWLHFSLGRSNPNTYFQPNGDELLGPVRLEDANRIRPRGLSENLDKLERLENTLCRDPPVY
jgi:hypothetical protein